MDKVRETTNVMVYIEEKTNDSKEENRVMGEENAPKIRCIVIWLGEEHESECSEGHGLLEQSEEAIQALQTN